MSLKKHLSALAAATWLLMLSAGHAVGFTPEDYFPLIEGDSWFYSFGLDITGGFSDHLPDGFHMSAPVKQWVYGTETINGVEAVRVGAKPPFDEYICWTHEPEGLSWHKWNHPSMGAYIIFDPPKLIFPKDFEQGQVYEGSSSYTKYSVVDDALTETGTVSYTVTLAGQGDVDVPAGTIPGCLNILVTETFQGADNCTVVNEMDMWLGPGIGTVKENSMETHTCPGEESPLVAVISLDMISAFVDGKRYGCPASLVMNKTTDPRALTLLKRFRDEVLSRSAPGRAIIGLYYFWGPAMSDILQENDLLRKSATGILRGILPVVEKILTFSNAQGPE